VDSARQICAISGVAVKEPGSNATDCIADLRRFDEKRKRINIAKCARAFETSSGARDRAIDFCEEQRPNKIWSQP
jgi:hypothetical protein